jgi:hypothetical protein
MTRGVSQARENMRQAVQESGIGLRDLSAATGLSMSRLDRRILNPESTAPLLLTDVVRVAEALDCVATFHEWFRDREAERAACIPEDRERNAFEIGRDYERSLMTKDTKA